MAWYKKEAQAFPIETTPAERAKAKAFKVLIFGVPGTPIFELASELSDYYDVDMYELQREYDDYWRDKIPALPFDTGDSLKGSESQHEHRDPASDRKRKAIDRFINMPNVQPDPLSYEDKIKIYGIPHGIIATEVAEPVLIQWVKNGKGVVFFLDMNEKKAVDWLKERRKCLSCGNTHHNKDAPPKHWGICDRCGTDLELIVSDQPRNVRHQYNVWRQDFTEFKKQLGKMDFIKKDMENRDLKQLVEECVMHLNERFS